MQFNRQNRDDRYVDPSSRWHSNILCARILLEKTFVVLPPHNLTAIL
jgi:hypothetical protein